MVNGDAKTLEGRIDAIVRYMRQNAGRLSSTTKVKIEFNCAGRHVTPRITFVEEERPFKF